MAEALKDKKPFHFDNLHENAPVVKVLTDYYAQRDGDDFLSVAHTPKDVVDYFVTDRTWNDMNTVSKGKEVAYVFDDDTTTDQKKRLSVVRKAWDALPMRWEEGGRGWSNLGDTFSALVADPANLVGLGLGGLISKFGMKAVTGVATTAALDAAIGAGMETADQSIEKEVGQREEYNIGDIATAGALSGAPTVAFAGAARGVQKFLGDAPTGAFVDPTKPADISGGAKARPFRDYADESLRGKTGPDRVAAPDVDMTPEEVLKYSTEGSEKVVEEVPVRDAGSETGASIKEVVKGKPVPNFRPEDITNEVELEGLLRSIAENEGIDWDAARAPGGGGKVSDAQLKELADTVGFDLDWMRSKTTAVNSATVVVAKRALDSTSRYLKGSAEALASAPDDAVAFDKFRSALNLHAAVQYRFAGLAAEAGRSLRAFRGDVDFGANDPAVTKTILDKFTSQFGNKPERLADFAAKLAVMDEAALARFARNATKATTKDKLVEIYKSSLLWNPKTQFVNTLSNFIVAQNRLLIEDPLATAVGGVRKALTGKDAASARETANAARHWWMGTVDGLKTAKEVFKVEGVYGQSRLDIPTYQALPGKRGEAVRLSMRLLNTVDAFFKVTSERAMLAREATRIAEREGLSGEAFAVRMRDLMASPTAEMTSKASKFAEEMTFQTDLGKLGKGVVQIVNGVPGGLGHMIVPFIRTPMNLAKYALRRLPVVGATGDIIEMAGGRMTGREFDQMIARQIQGTAIFAGVYAGVKAGVITGSNEENIGDGAKGYELKQLRASATGSQEFSARFGDTWFSYNQFDPFAMLAGLAADAAVIADRLAAEDKEFFSTELAVGLWKAGTSALISKTWAQGVEDLAKIFGDNPEYNVNRFMQSRVASLVPTLSAHWARTSDLTVRTPTKDDFVKGLYDAIAARMPGKSTEVGPMVDVFGNIVERRAGPLEPSADAFGFTSRDVVNDPIKKEVLNLVENFKMAAPRAIPKVVRGYTLTDEERRAMQYIKGKTYYNLLTTIMADPDYSGLTPAQKISEVKGVEQMAAEAAHIFMAKNFPGYFKGVFWRKADQTYYKNVPGEVESYYRDELGVRPLGAEQ